MPKAEFKIEITLKDLLEQLIDPATTEIKLKNEDAFALIKLIQKQEVQIRLDVTINENNGFTTMKKI